MLSHFDSCLNDFFSRIHIRIVAILLLVLRFSLNLNLSMSIWLSWCDIAGSYPFLKVFSLP